MYNKILFSEYNFSEMRDSVVLLDVDGTLGPHNLSSVSENVRRQIALITKNGNVIYITSNNKDTARNRKLAMELGVECLETKHRKPSIRVIESIRHMVRSRSIVVIGDKMLTDGLFARRLEATFIHVKRVISPCDPIIVRLQYVMDWVVELAVISLKAF